MSATTPSFAFLLFNLPPAVEVAAVSGAHAELNPGAPALVGETAKSSEDGAALKFADGKGDILLSVVPAPIPAGEAEAVADFSLSRFFDATTRPLIKHGAHAIVALTPWAGGKPQEELTRLSWGVAATAKAAGATAVYWGIGSVTHPAEFFIERVRISGNSKDITQLLPLWFGISIGAERNGVSVLTLGMREQFGLPDLKVWAPQGSEQEALVYAFDLISYVIGRGVEIAAGETVGRTADERLIVRYESSPNGKPDDVMCVDLPATRSWWPFRR